MPLILSGLRATEGDPYAPDALFKGKTWQDIGVDKDFTAYLHKKHDPDGSKYGGDDEALKRGILNEMTTRKSGMVSSAMDFFRSMGENEVQRQHSNLMERLYESAPNRVFSPDSSVGDRLAALGSVAKGAFWGEGAVPWELALNLAMSPFAVARMGLGGLSALAKSATLEGAAGRIMGGEAAQELVQRLGSGYVWKEGEREAMEALLKKQSWREVVKRSAMFEGAMGAGAGGIGGALEYGALENRGIDAGSLLGSVAGGALMGGIAGGVIGGGVAGLTDARTVAREVVGGGTARGMGEGAPSVPQAANNFAGQLRQNLEAEMAGGGQAAQQFDPALREQIVGTAEAIKRMSTVVRELWDEAGGSADASRFSRDTLAEMSSTMARSADAEAIAAAKRAQAQRLRLEQNNPQALEQAGLLDSEALSLERFVALMRDPSQLARLEEAPTAEIEGTIAQALAVLNPKLARMMDEDIARAAGNVAPPPKNQPAAGQATATPTQPTNPVAPSGAQAGTAQSQATPGPKAQDAAAPAPAAGQAAAAPAPADQAGAQAAGAAATSPQETAAVGAELDQLLPMMDDYSKGAVADAEADLEKVGLDLPTAISRVQSDGDAGNLAGEIAKATGQKRGDVKTRLNKALAAITRARDARAKQAEGANQDAAQAQTQAAAPAPAGGEAATQPTARQDAAPEAQSASQESAAEPDAAGDKAAVELIDEAEVEDAAALTYESLSSRVMEPILQAKARILAITTNFLDRIVAEREAAPASTPELDARLAAAAKELDAASDRLEKLASLEGEAATGRGKAVLDEAKARLSAAEAEYKAATEAMREYRASKSVVRDIEAELEKLRQDPDLGPLFSRIRAEDLMTKDGVDKAMSMIDMAAKKSVSWTYAKAILPVMRDKFNVVQFEQLLSLMPGVPESARRQIVSDFKVEAKKAVAVMFGRLGSFDAVRRELGNRAVDILEGAEQPAAVDIKLPKAFDKVDIKSIIDAAVADAPEGMDKEVAKALRQLRSELEVLGVASDEQFVRMAMAARAADVVKRKYGTLFDRAVRKQVEEAMKEADSVWYRSLNYEDMFEFEEEMYRIVGRLEPYSILGKKEDEKWSGRGAMLENPILYEIGKGKFDILSGRRQSRNIAGKVDVGGLQGFMVPSNRFGFVGKLRSSVESYGGARSAVRDTAEAAVKRATNRRQSIELEGGKKIVLTQKEVAGRYFEDLANRMLRNRWNRIVEAVRKREAGEMTEDEFAAFREAESGFMKKVLDSEVAMAMEYNEALERVKAAREMAQREAEEIAAEWEAGGAERAAELQARLARVVASSGNRILSGDMVKAPKAKKTQGDAVKVKLANGTDVEFVPARAITLTPEGRVMLFEQDVGTYTRNGDRIVANIVGNDKPIEVMTGVFGLGKAKRFLKSKVVRDVIEANSGTMAKAGGTAEALPEGSTIPEGFTRTEEVEAAKAEITGDKAATVTDAVRASPPSAFKTAPGHILVLRKKGTDTFITVKPGTKKIGDLIKSDQGEWLIGQMPAEQSTTGGWKYRGYSTSYKLANFLPLGREPGKVKPARQRVIDAVEGDKDMAPEIARAQRSPITLKFAHGIKLPDGSTLGSVYEKFVSLTNGSEMPKSAEALEKLIAEATSLAETLDAFAPHGIHMPGHSRRASFYSLAQAMNSSTKAELGAALDVLRRLDTGSRGMPLFQRTEGGSSFFAAPGAETPEPVRVQNAIYLGSGKDGMLSSALPTHIKAIHEVGHWAYTNLLTPRQQIDYLAYLRKFYKNGKLDEVALRSATDIEPMRGHMLTHTNELFATHFQAYVMEAVRGGRFAPEEESLWRSAVRIVRQIFEWMIGDRKNIDPEVRVLFERILPPEPREQRFVYGSMLDVRTGERVPSTSAIDDRHERALKIAASAEKIDTLIGRLDNHLFSLTGTSTQAMADDMKAAALHMWGLLYGSDTGTVTEGLRRALRPFEYVAKRDEKGNRIVKRNERNKPIKDADGKNIPVLETRAVPGAIVHRKLFGKYGGGEVMEAIRDSLPIVRSLNDKVGEGEESLESIAASMVDDGQAALFNAHYERRFDELVAQGKTPEEADDAAWAEAEARYGVKEDSSVWSQMTSGMTKDDKRDMAMRVVGLQLRDLMTDALEHLERSIHDNGFLLEKNTLAKRSSPAAEVTTAQAEAKAAIRKAASKSKGPPKKVPEPLELASDESVEAARREAAQRSGDTASRGLPEGAPPIVKAAVSRVTHRDPEQRELMQGIGADIFNLLGISDPTNADVARLVGFDLEPGLSPDAPATDSAAFSALREALREATEALTNASKDPAGAVNRLAELMANGRYPDVSSAKLARGVVANMKRAAQKGLDEREEALLDDEVLSPMISKLTADVTHLLAGRVKTEAAKTLAPVANKTPVAAVVQVNPTIDGGLHPHFARRAVNQAIDLMEDAQVDRLVSDLGLDTMGMDPRDFLKNSIFFVQTGSKARGSVLRKVDRRPGTSIAYEVMNRFGGGVTTTFEGRPKLKALFEELDALDRQSLDSINMTNQQVMEIAARRQSVLDAIREEEPSLAEETDAVDAVVVDMGSVIDLSTTDESVGKALLSAYTSYLKDPANKAKRAAYSSFVIDELSKLQSLGKFADMAYVMLNALGSTKFADMLRKAGYSGVATREDLMILPGVRMVKLDAAIQDAIKSAPRSPQLPDAPLAGELALGVAMRPDAKVSSLGIQQRALQMGVSPEQASFVSRLAPGRGLPEPEDAMKQARAFGWVVQIRENSSRLRKMGQHWLANMVKPVDGTGFIESHHSAMGKYLAPVLKSLDEVSGRDNGLKRWASDLWRSAALWRETIPQSKAEERIARALRFDDLSKLSDAERRAALEIVDFFEGLRIEQERVGIPVADVRGKMGGSSYYLPQRFNRLWIEKNPDEAVKRLTKFFVREGRDEADAKLSAIKIVNRVRSDDEGGQYVGAANAAADTLYARVLNIPGREMEELGLVDLFDNNLRSLMIGYANNSLTRVEATRRFGVRNHALDTYHDIAKRGIAGAVDALTKTKQGMRRIVGSELTDGMMENEIEFTQELFSPLFSDKAQAQQAVMSVLQTLAGTDSLLARKEAAISDLVSAYIAQGGRGVQHFAKHAEAIVNALSDFGPYGNKLHGKEMVFAKDFIGRLTGEAHVTSDDASRLNPFVRGMMAFNSVTLLSMSTLASISDAAFPLVRSGNFGAFLKGQAQLAKQIAGLGPEGIQAANRIGVALDQSIHQAIQDVHGGRLGRFTTAFFLANGLTPWTNTMRRVSAVVGFESLRTAQSIAQREKAAGRFESRAYMKNVRYLRQLGAAGLIDAPPLTTLADAEGNEIVRQALQRFVNESVFQPSRNDIPLQFQDNPFWKLAFQLKSYPMMLGRMMRRTLAEAVATETSESGKKVYVGDVKPLLFLMSVGVGLAGASQAVRDIVSGRNEEADEYDSSTWRSVRDRRLSRIVQELGFEDYEMDDDEIDSFLGWYAESLLALGALGMVGDIFYQSARALDNGSFGRERIMSNLFGPSVGTFSSLLQALEGGMEAARNAAGAGDDANGKERAAARAVLSRIPLVGSQRPLIEGWVDEIAGERP